MTEAEILKLIFQQLPSIAIVVGVAKIYYKIARFIEKIEVTVKQNSDDIELIKRKHVARHADDAIEIYQRRKTDG